MGGFLGEYLGWGKWGRGHVGKRRSRGEGVQGPTW
jgi:hypothetical protein